MSLRERIPSHAAWLNRPVPPQIRSERTLAISVWQCGPVTVISELAVIELPRGGTGETWFVSISAEGKRPKPKQVRKALRAFGMTDAEEDNHYPGVTRGYFMPVDPGARVDCECKLSEDTIVEGDGYTWTNPNDRSPCRGCELEAALGKPCPIHTSTQDVEIRRPGASERA